MKKIISLVLIAALALSLCGCGKSEEVKSFEAALAELGEIDIESGDKIAELEAMYAALSDEDKEKAEGLEILTAARDSYDALLEGLKDSLDGSEWYFNGGNDTTLGVLEFGKGKCKLMFYTFTGNGKTAITKDEYSDYVITADNIVISYEGDKEVLVPYTLDNGTVMPGEGFLTLKQVKEDLQGCWESEVKEYIPVIYFTTHTIHCIEIKNATYVWEHAADAANGGPGEFYYYGPDKGSFEIRSGTVDMDSESWDEFFVNVIDGEAVLLHYQHVCERSSGLPGPNGYSFP